jgi:hypothetical protein
MFFKFWAAFSGRNGFERQKILALMSRSKKERYLLSFYFLSIGAIFIVWISRAASPLVAHSKSPDGIP